MARGRMPPVIVVALIASYVSVSAAQLIAPYFTSFETGQDGWGVLVRNWACPCPEATLNFSSPTAKLSGAAGLQVSITVPSDQGWHVQARSPQFNMTAGNVYTACVWLRAAATLGGAGTVSFSLLTTNTYETLGWAGTNVGTNWTQLCMRNIVLNVSAVTYYTLDFGLNTGSVFVDDMNVTTGAMPSPSPPPSPSPIAAPPGDSLVLINTSFEAGQQSWSTLVRNWACPCPQATFDFASSAAAYTGSKGVEVNVQVPSDQGWHVQLQSPRFNVSSGQRYTVCVWLRAATVPLMTGSGKMSMSLLKTETYDGLGWAQATVTTSWAQVCLADVLISINATVYVTIDLGTNTGIYHLDDFTAINGRSSGGISIPATNGPLTAPYSTSYESGQANWIGSKKNTSTASFNFSSSAAMRTGSNGVEIAVQVPSVERWDIQLQSPRFAINTSFMYTGCVWLRTPGGLSAGNHVPFVMLEEGTYAMFSSGQALVTPVWSQVCVMDFRPSRNTSAFFTLDLGRFVGTVYVDDFTFTARSNYNPEEVTYVSSAAIADRINAHRKGNLTFNFVNGTTGQPITQPVTRLEVRLARHDFPFGTAMEWESVPTEKRSWYLERAKYHFNALVPEWSFKWPSVEPSKNNTAYRYGKLMSDHVQFAADNDFVMARGHTLEWLIPSPSFGDHWSRLDGCDAYRTYLETRIRREVTNFKGKFNSYDVFNEIIHDRDFVENCPGMWPAILYDGFRWAHEADPTARLCLNDYGLITGDDWQAMITYVSGMLQQGVPINCIGVQAYVPLTNRPSTAYMRTRLEALAGLGLDIVITEFNFWTSWASSGNPVWEGTDAEHAALYEEYVPFWFSVPYIKGIMMWNFWDGSNWITNGGIYRLDGTPKASALAVGDMWNNRWRTNVALSNVVLPNGQATINGFYGKYNYTLELDGRVFSGVMDFPKNAGAQTVTISLA